MKQPKLDQMTTAQRIKYLKDTNHLVVKWVNRLEVGGEPKYHRDSLPHLTKRLSEATLYDMKYFVEKISGYSPFAVTKKQLFEARLKGT